MNITQTTEEYLKAEALDWLNLKWGHSKEMENREEYNAFLAGYLLALQDIEIDMEVNEHDYTKHPKITLSNFINRMSRAAEGLINK